MLQQNGRTLGPLTRKDFVNDDPETPQIGRGVGSLVTHLFGRYVVGCSHEDPGNGQCLFGGRVTGELHARTHQPSQTEIQNLRRSVRADDHIARLQVPVNDAGSLRLY